MLARVRSFAPTGFFALLICYFLINALTGAHGLLTHRGRDDMLAARITEVASLRAQHADLQRGVDLLRDEHLSRDLLEERAHHRLGFAGPGDYVVRVRP